MALLALGELITNSEDVKVKLGEMGYLEFSNIIKKSQVHLDILAFDMCMELAFTRGSIRSILGRSTQLRSHTPSGNLHDFSNTHLQQLQRLFLPLMYLPLCTAKPLLVHAIRSNPWIYPHFHYL